MKTYEVRFAKMFDEDGCGIDFPTDSLLTRIDCTPDFQEMFPPAVCPGEGIEVWKYEVTEEDAANFESDLDRCATVKSYSELDNL